MQGLLTHSVSVSDSQQVSLGTVLDRERRHSALAPPRFWKLRRGVDAILQAKTVMGTTLEVVIGHATFCSLLAHPALSCLHSVCKYIQRIGPSRGILWDTVRGELREFQGLMVLLVAAWDRGWVLVVLASDASEWGYGVPAMTAKSSEAAKTGHVAERSRFRHAWPVRGLPRTVGSGGWSGRREPA